MTKKDNNTSDQFDEELDEYQKSLAAAVIPDYFLSEQFCNSGIENTDYTIPPTTSANPSIASLDTGAPPLQQVKPDLGGSPFPRQEYNGILRLLSNLLAYQNKGNYFTFDSKNVNGYQMGAILFNYATNQWVRSLKDNNTVNFITDPTKIDNINWAFITVNPNTANNFTISPTVPTPAINDNSLKAINSAFFFNNYATATKYNFVVTSQNTPTFAAGEEYIISPANYNGYAEYSLTLRGQYQTGSTSYGEITITFSIDHNISLGFGTSDIKIISISQSMTPVLTQTQLNNLFTFTAYFSSASYTINSVTIPSSTIIYTIKLNSALPYSGTTNSIFASISTNNIVSYNTTVNSTLAPAMLGVLPSAIPGSNAVVTPKYVAYLDSPAFTGIPTAPTAPKGTNTDQLATMAALSAGLADKQDSLGFIPVQQGGGAGQNQSKIYIGWAADGSGLKAQVDATDQGIFAFRSWVNSQITNNGSGIIDTGTNASGSYIRFYSGLKICYGYATGPNETEPWGWLLPYVYINPPIVVGTNTTTAVAVTTSIFNVTVTGFSVLRTKQIQWISIGI